jgi:hypothetical protein
MKICNCFVDFSSIVIGSLVLPDAKGDALAATGVPQVYNATVHTVFRNDSTVFGRTSGCSAFDI